MWTSASLFEDMTYDRGLASAHFFQGQLLDMVASLPSTDSDGDEGMTPGELRRRFKAELERDPDIYRSVFLFLDGLQPGNLKYQRLLAAHLVLMVTLNAFGYDYQRTAPEGMRRIVDLLEPAIRRNFVVLVSQVHLERHEDIEILLTMRVAETDTRR